MTESGADAGSSADDRAALLAAYDAQLRTDAETPSAVSVVRLGPLRLVTFAGGRGFVTYRDLGGAGAAQARGLVADALAHYRAGSGAGPRCRRGADVASTAP